MIVNEDPVYPSYASPACIECINRLDSRIGFNFDNGYERMFFFEVLKIM